MTDKPFEWDETDKVLAAANALTYTARAIGQLPDVLKQVIKDQTSVTPTRLAAAAETLAQLSDAILGIEPELAPEPAPHPDCGNHAFGYPESMVCDLPSGHAGPRHEHHDGGRLVLSWLREPQ